jgi:hypothetical protein
MSDLNKLMEKLKANDPKDPVKVEEVKPAQKDLPTTNVGKLPVKAPAQVETLPEKFDDDLDDDDLDKDDDDEETPQETEELSDTVTNVDVDGTDIPVEDQNPAHTIEAEIGILQNNGIFRRELLATLKELVNVHKINAQAMLDLKDLLEDLNGKKSTK